MNGEIGISPAIAAMIGPVAKELGWDMAKLTVDEHPLGSTNSSFAVKYGGGDYIIRIATNTSDVLAINRRAEYAAVKVMSELGKGAPLMYFSTDTGNMVTKRIAGRELSGEDYADENTVFAALGLLRLMHSQKTAYSFDPYADIEKRLAYVRGRGVTLHPRFGEVYALYAKLRDRNPLKTSKYRGLCHADPFANNFIMTESGELKLLDYEFSGMCDVFYDLASAFGWCPAEQKRRLLDFYFGESGDGLLQRFEDFTYIQIMWNCTWSYVKSCEETINGVDYLEGGHHHVELLLERAGNLSL